MAMLQCLADSVDAMHANDLKNWTQWLLIVTGAMVFFMQAGFAMVCAGAIRIKNVQNTMLKNLLDACGAALGFYSFGYAFAYGVRDGDKTTFIGLNNFFLMGDVDYSFWLYEFAFAATATTIVAGTLAERCQMAAYLCYSVLLGGIVYPIVVHAIWSSHGFVSAFNVNPLFGSGAIDFAGSGVVHTCGGSAALWATIVLGPRRGRFYDSRGAPLAKPKPFPGHSVSLQMLGTFILWFGCK
jgi:Amt family ammonium transporter